MFLCLYIIYTYVFLIALLDIHALKVWTLEQIGCYHQRIKTAAILNENKKRRFTVASNKAKTE